MISNVVNTCSKESSQMLEVKYSNFTSNSSIETLIILLLILNFLAGVMVKYLLSFLDACIFTQTMLSL